MTTLNDDLVVRASLDPSGVVSGSATAIAATQGYINSAVAAQGQLSAAQDILLAKANGVLAASTRIDVADKAAVTRLLERVTATKLLAEAMGNATLVSAQLSAAAANITNTVAGITATADATAKLGAAAAASASSTQALSGAEAELNSRVNGLLAASTRVNLSDAESVRLLRERIAATRDLANSMGALELVQTRLRTAMGNTVVARPTITPVAAATPFSTNALSAAEDQLISKMNGLIAASARLDVTDAAAVARLQQRIAATQTLAAAMGQSAAMNTTLAVINTNVANATAAAASAASTQATATATAAGAMNAGAGAATAQAAALNNVAAGARNAAGGLGAARQGAIGLGGAAQAAGGGAAAAGAALGGMGNNAGASALGVGRIRQGLVSLVAQMTGTIPVLDRIGFSLLQMSQGSVVTMGVLAGIAAMVGAYRLFTIEARELKKAQDDALASLVAFEREKNKSSANDVATRQKGAETSLAGKEDSRATLERMKKDVVTPQGLVLYGVAEAIERIRGLTKDKLAALRVEVARGVADVGVEATKKWLENERNSEVTLAASLVTSGSPFKAVAVRDRKAAQDLLDQQKALLSQVSTQSGTGFRQLQDLLNTQVETLDKALNPKQPKGPSDNSLWAQHIAAIRSVIDIYKDLEREHTVTATSTLRLLSTFQSLDAEIASQKDQFSKHAADLKKLREEMQRTDFGQAVLTRPELSVTPAKSAGESLAGPPEGVLHNLDMMVNREQMLVALGRTHTQDYADTIAALVIQGRYLDAIVRREGETNETLAKRIELNKELRKYNEEHFAGLAGPAPGERLFPNSPSIPERAADVKAAQDAANAAREVGASNAEALEKRANDMRREAIALIKAQIEGMASMGEPTREMIAALAVLNDALGTMDASTKDSGSNWGALAVGMRGVLDAASGLNVISKDLRNAVNEAEHLGSSIKTIKKSMAEANGAGGFTASNALAMGAGIIGAVGATVGIIKSVGDLFSHHDQALVDNTKKLEEVRLSMVDTKGVGGQQNILNALEKFNASLGGAGFKLPDFVGMQEKIFIPQILKDAGISRAEFDAQLKALGITLSKTSTQGLGQFDEALKLSIQAAGKFSASLSDQTSLRALHDKVFGLTSDADKFRSSLTLLDQFAPRLGASLDGIDITTQEGRDKIREALKGFVTSIENGTLTPEQLGKLAGVKDFAQIIGTLTDSLDAMNKATNAVTASTTNLPAWYKLATTQWATAGAIAPPPTVTTVARTSPVTPPTGGGADTTPSIIVNGDLVIPTQSLTPTEIARSTVSVLKSKSQTQFGTPVRWSEVQSV